MADQVFAVLGLVLCVLVWGSMWLGPARAQGLRHRALRWWRQATAPRRAAPRQVQADARRARAAAEAAIARARRASHAAPVSREGNVYRPDRFQQGLAGKDGPDVPNGPDGSDRLH